MIFWLWNTFLVIKVISGFYPVVIKSWKLLVLPDIHTQWQMKIPQEVIFKLRHCHMIQVSSKGLGISF